MRTIAISPLLLLLLFSFVTPIQPSYQSHSIEFPTGQTGISYENSPTIIRVIDGNAAGSESVPIQITSTTDSVGVTLDLPATAPGIFESDKFVIMDGPNLVSNDSTVPLIFEDSNSNFDPGFPPESVLVLVESSSGDVEFITLMEDGIDSPFFTTDLVFSSEEAITPFDGVLQSSNGDTFRIFWPCDGASNGQVVPKRDNSKGAIEEAVGETVTFSYTDAALSTVKTSLDVVFSSGCGGSGGGLVISPVVLNVLGGTSGGDFAPPLLTIPKLNLSSLPLVGDILNFIQNADPFTVITPLDDPSIDYPISINDNGYLLTQFANTIETYQGKTGEPVSFKMTLTDATGVEHIGLYTNLRGDAREIEDSDTFVIYNEDKPLEITDPHGLFSNVNFTESEYNGKYIADFNMTFAKPMETSDVIIRTWDELKNSGDIKVFDAIKIEGEPIVNPDTNNLIIPDSAEIVIPYYKLPYYEILNADSDGNLIYYNSFGGLEEKQVHPYYSPTIYPDSVGRNERHDDGFYEKILNEETRAQTLVQSLIGNPFTPSEDKVENEKFLYPNNVGKLDRENKSTLNDVMIKEHLEATKIWNKLYNTNHLED